MFGNYCAGFMGLHGFGALIASGLFVAIVVISLIAIFGGHRVKGGTCDDAMKELRMRLARGEITKEEYESVKASL